MEEAIPLNALVETSKEAYLIFFVDSEHACDSLTQQLINGFMIFMSISLIQWLLKKLPTIKMSVFGE